MNKYTGFEKLLKQKIDNFEYPYDNKEWLDFEKKLPKSPRHFVSSKNIIKAFVITAAVVVPVLTILYFHNNSEKQNSQNNVVNINNNNKTDNNNLTNDNSNNTNIQQLQNSKNNPKDNKSTLVNESKSNDNNAETSEGNDLDKSIKNSTTTSSTIKNTEINNSVPNINIVKNQMNYGYITANITEGCAPINVQFKPAIISDTISYLWAFGDNTKASLKKTPSHTYTKAGSYSVTLTVKFKKSGLVKKINYADFIKVKGSPEAKFSYSQDLETDVISFKDNSINSTAWLWSLGDKATSTEQNPQHEYLSNGTYSVRLIAVNSEGCSDTNITRITVKNKPPFFLSSGYKPDDPNGGYFGPSGVDMNPDGYRFSIYDKTGKLMFETTNLETKWDGKIKGSNTPAPSGVYVCKITMKNKHGVLTDYWPLSVTLIR